MPTKKDLKKQLETILDHKFGPGAGISLRHEIALYTVLTGSTTWTLLGGDIPQNECHYGYDMLDVTGDAYTGNDGTILFRLSSYVCLNPYFTLLPGPINVIATPFSSKPLFLTIEHSFDHDKKDVEIKVYSWDANGGAAPIVPFNWRCHVRCVRHP